MLEFQMEIYNTTKNYQICKVKITVFSLIIHPYQICKVKITVFSLIIDPFWRLLWLGRSPLFKEMWS